MHNKTPENPSKKATQRVKDPQTVPVQCQYCLDVVEVQHHDRIYGKAYGDWPWMYVCVGCGARVGMHPFTAIPLGALADASTREARKRCKPAFERLWNSGRMGRSEAYSWLAGKLGLTASRCHFGLFDAETCKRASDICNDYANTA